MFEVHLRTRKAVLATVRFGAIVEPGLLAEVFATASRPGLHAPPIILVNSRAGATLAPSDVSVFCVNDILVVLDGVIQETALAIRTLLTLVQIGCIMLGHNV